MKEGTFAILFLGAIAVFAAGFVLWVQHEREALRAFCQPRGYVGGTLGEKYVGPSCFDANGNAVLLKDIKP